jgi:pyruvate,water dikinase
MRENREPDEAEAERLRFEFRRRYHWFGRLLRSNRSALEDMAEIQALLRSDRPFSMVRVRTICARVSLEVWKIVDSMRRLAPGKYDILEENFTAVRAEMDARLQPLRKKEAGPLVLDMSEVDLSRRDMVGSKLAVLGEISNKLGLKTPGGFAVTVAGFERFMRDNELGEEIERRIRAADASDLDELHALSSSIQSLIMESPLPGDLESEFSRASARYDGPMAVRSSALAEDSAETSFAGLHRSELNVSRENLLTAFKEVVASLYSLPAMTYRFNRGIPDYDAIMCVGVLEMVRARSGGVLYTIDPLGRVEHMVINAVWGLPKPVVEGRCAGDVFHVSTDGDKVEKIETDDKECEFLALPEEGVARQYLDPEERMIPSLSEEEALELASVAKRLEEHFGGPLDVEWIIDPDGRVVLLQSRPLHSMQSGPVTKSDSGDALLRGGTPASSGVAGGPVHLVKKTIDTLDFPEGAVLVTTVALPELASLLGRAAAVVAETGSVTGHLASVCREYGVPALFGVDRATEELTDGREVTVDADNGLVLPGPPPEGAVRERAWSNVETPVHRALKSAAELITPLHLLDPSSPYFRAANSRTYHDITRFCHEKAVEEMFRFGRDHEFPERSSKQLVYKDMPTQWWVLNLDDGFKTEVQGRYVRLDEITCRPMLAIFEGVTAVPWEGPPPIDAGGFLAVMYRSTIDRSLAAGGPAKQTERNYFMISRDYCSLSSRLGYHFSTVETLVTGRTAENYAIFRFQGGAADDERRMRRVRLIADILEDYGFSSEIREDNLTARIQSLPEEDMYQSLRILGFLSIHTRQIDMVMSSPAEVSRYDKKLRREMDEALKTA